MANVNITVRMDEGLKKEAEALFDQLGMSLTTAINIFVSQSVRESRIPFEVTTKPRKSHESVCKPNVSYALVEVPHFSGTSQ
ncbi:type II toxin-antitoxin system RelB/DinJ family antitoxin [Adlercreutzia sp. ZJ138]|uniref:type II toxin-antitoxin system RelB/DinJ family antitoxin n=1 Tax=Adlercreutzia sp. ZJ138 TaxID=2709405 RepID=UPI0013EE0625|nr:type II toxin-antitoxin system RelB/DinJ family antitoxin [Adlercreutzia sp. ZJ138]